MLRAPASLQLMPFFPFFEKYLVLLSVGSILNEMIPASENIMESSQHTPIKRMKVVDSLLTDQSGYPVTWPIIAFPISYSQCTP